MKIPKGGPPRNPRSLSLGTFLFLVYLWHPAKMSRAGVPCPRGDGRSFSHRIKLNEVAHGMLRDALVPLSAADEHIQKDKSRAMAGPVSLSGLPPGLCVLTPDRKAGELSARWELGPGLIIWLSFITVGRAPQSQGRPKCRACP